MKKLILTAVVAVCVSVSVNAQVKFGAKVGLNASTLTGDNDDDFEPKLGLNIGAFAEIKISEKFAFQPELVYSMQGAKVEETDANFSYESNIKLNYLNIPLTAKYYVIEKLAVEFGPQIGFLLSAKEDWKETVNGTTTSGEDDVKDDLDSIDLGLNFGASYNIDDNIQVGARYNLGLTDIADIGGFEMKNSVFLLSVGFKF